MAVQFGYIFAREAARCRKPKDEALIQDFAAIPIKKRRQRRLPWAWHLGLPSEGGQGHPNSRARKPNDGDASSPYGRCWGKDRVEIRHRGTLPSLQKFRRIGSFFYGRAAFSSTYMNEANQSILRRQPQRPLDVLIITRRAGYPDGLVAAGMQGVQ